MSSPAKLPADLDVVFRNSLLTVNDPGSAGTISIAHKGLAICEVVTAGAETRALESATHFGVGQRALVILKTDGGDLSITGAAATVVLADAGDFAEFVVSLSGSTKVWKLLTSNVGAEPAANFPVVLTAYEFAATATAEDNQLMIIQLLGDLETAGLIDDSAITVGA